MKQGIGSDIWLIDVRGGKPLRLTDNGSTDINPVWFPDGGSIAFTRIESNQSSIYRTPRLGGGSVFMVANAFHPAISPDGKKIAFSRADGGGFHRIWVGPTDSMNQATRLTDDSSGLWDHGRPSWSPDGSTLCYEDVRNLWTVPVDGGTPRSLTDDDAIDTHCTWSRDGNSVYLSSYRDGVTAIWRRSLLSGTMKRITLGTGAVRPMPEIAPLSPSAGMGRFDVSADGRLIAWAEEEDFGDLWLLEAEDPRF